jgi:hypothetical protein
LFQSIDARSDFLSKTAHLCLEGLELQHERFNAKIRKMPDASCNGIVAANQAGRRSAVATEGWIAGEGLEHYGFGVSSSRHCLPQRRILLCEAEQVAQFFFGLRASPSHTIRCPMAMISIAPANT